MKEHSVAALPSRRLIGCAAALACVFFPVFSAFSQEASPPPDRPAQAAEPAKPAPVPPPAGGGGGIINSDIVAPKNVPALKDLPALVIPKRAGERALPRVPKQELKKPYAETTFGIDYQMYMTPSDGTRWDLPLIGDSFHGVTAPSMSSLNLAIGGLHFFNRADLYASIPLVALGGVPVEETTHKREMTNSYLVALGAKIYPLPIDPGAVRPYVALGLARRRFTLMPADEPTASFEEARQWTLPIGAGVAYRTDFSLMFDFSIQYTPVDDFTIYTGVHPQQLKEKAPKFQSKDIDLSSLLLTFSVRWVTDFTKGINEEEFRQDEAQRLGRLMREERASGLTLSLGFGGRLANNGSDYFEEHRPYLASSYAENPFPALSVGYYEFEWDAEVRLSYRAFSGDAHAYGSSMKAGQHGFYLEAFKMFDLDHYGFVPWVGLGVGYQLYDFKDVAPVKIGVGAAELFTVNKDDSGVVLSVPFGFDIRTNPSNWWFLRTSFRWVPFADVDVASGVTFDYGGLEFEAISFVMYPQRLMKPSDDD